ncbi:MAG: dienelactone hydrolase family protein [Spirochaetota bacterium]
MAQAKNPVQTNSGFTSADDTVLNAYIAKPSRPGRHPGIIMVHEWWGLSADIAAMADRLAAEGFVVLAVDAYRGKLAQSAQEAGTLRNGTPPAQLAADLDAAYIWLSRQAEIDGTRMGATGFCFGGVQAMLLGTRQAGLSAVAILYGSGLIQKEEDLGALGRKGAVLGIFGDKDNGIPAAQRQGFKDALSTRNARYAESVYIGVGHAFVTDAAVDNPSPARQAWKQVVAFFRDELKVD